MSNLRPPQIVSDLYRDLRDRRLLIPVVALLVAIVAVPVLLSSSGEAVVEPPLDAGVAVDEASAVSPAVLVDDAGIRNYRERLEALKNKNPFKQKFTVSVADASGSEEAAGASTASSAPPAPSDGSTVAGDVTAGTDPLPSTPSADPEPPQPSTSDTTPAVDDEATGEDPNVADAGDELVFYTGKVNITFGPLGDAKRHTGIKRFESLPNERESVIAFLGLSDDSERAFFLLSPQVVESDGDGSCSPKQPAPCQFLEIGLGEQRMIHVADPEGGELTTYRLRLHDTKIVEIDDPRD